MSDEICLLLQFVSGDALRLSLQEWVLGRKGAYLSALARSGETQLLPLSPEVASTISKAHARLRCAEGGIFVEDMRSANGVFLNGLPLRPLHPAPLVAGDRLRLGALLLTVSLIPCQE